LLAGTAETLTVSAVTEIVVADFAAICSAQRRVYALAANGRSSGVPGGSGVTGSS